ncbi:MAG: protein-export chaperone SecB [Deltaproteobacteria bacterium]|nr:protein-export chaperone SecB [Deltaproteobacteria bacterium]
MSGQNPQFELKHIYIKDLSFESPQSPEIFQKEWNPAISVDLSCESRKFSEEGYEVSLQVTVTAKDNEHDVYIAEAHQAGIFLARNFEKEQLNHFLNVYCPSLLFPYLRESISGLVTRGGFTPIYLAPVNFDLLFQQQAEAKVNNRTV